MIPRYDPTLGVAVVTDHRIDYRTEQAVNVAIGMMRDRRSHADVTAYLNDRMVPAHVIAKVIDGRAARRM